jgi:hypothetical protein
MRVCERAIWIAGSCSLIGCYGRKLGNESMNEKEVMVGERMVQKR